MNHRFLSFFPVLTLMLAAATIGADADEHRVPRASLPLMNSAPAIDGDISESEWARAIRMERFCGVRSPVLTGGKASFWIGCDGTRIYVAVKSETPPGGQLLNGVEPAPQGGDARVWLDDSIELVFDPLRTAPESRRRLYHAIINAQGAIYDQRHATKGGGEAWRGRWETASKIADDRWWFEAALPLSDMDVKPADLKHPFGVRVCRNWKRSAGPGQSEWSSVGGAFLSVETMPEITWDAAAPIVQTRQLHDPEGTTPHVVVSIANPGGTPLPVNVALRIHPRSSAKVDREERLTIPGNQAVVVDLASSMALGDVAHTCVEVTSPDAGKVYYQRDFRWQMERTEPFFTLTTEGKKHVKLEFAHLPYHGVIKAKIDISGLKEKAGVTGVHLALRPKDGSPLAETAMPPLSDFKTEIEWSIPSLTEGSYELVASIDGQATGPVIASFVRHVFPWEHNKIGASDLLVPPFTPIEVKGARVSTVLRTHTVAPTGLWQQVKSLGVGLLREPMRLDATVAGNTSTAIGKGLTYDLQRDTRAVANGAWSAGSLEGSVTTDWDVDGSMKWTLRLAPTDQSVDSLTLTIPLQNARSPLMHACTDGIRFNYAGVVPEGDGVVWRSSQAARNSIIGSYVPYLWVGAEERGLCVYGENDAGWITHPEVSCQELVRRGDSLDLVLHLIAKPGSISAPRTITMAFQATPVKPMPKDWRRWTFGAWRAAGIPGVRHVAFMGSCWYWGTETPCLDWYPRGQDWTYFHKLAETRRTGEVDKAFIEEWLKGFEHIYASAKTPEKRKHLEKIFRNHTNAAFHTMKGRPKTLNIYTNGRGVRFDTPEGQTFLDEWHRDAYSKRDWPPRGGAAYDLDPVASFRDYAMSHFRTMAEIMVDSFYWDDLFFQSNFDTIGTPAYVLPSGHIQPSMGLYNMREWVHRTARMQLEMGKPVRNIIHMTNTAITPVLAFAQMNYTWEDKGGAADFQDRFDRDYTRAESIGLQQGNVPFALWLVHTKDKAQARWVERTGTGCMLVHEIKTSGGGETFWGIFRLMMEYGYGLPEVKVSQYWKKDHPAALAGSDAVSLVMSKPGSALILVCDYGNGGDLKLTLDQGALGLEGTLAATDRETNSRLRVTPNGTVQFPLKKHDFKLVLVEANTP
ncbi:MAG: hypothetical protein HN742_26660 [Lentisphaerae bacterium]|nr:hypothetical protein [Lentisphaerota bacterium]MBT5606046.1 hypothetical protein [Lentisphaerota bacterium]MBT7058565.1 hypothetical protein [Lentisphaerota bacterium]MBT7845485.1 hypothetical protein [Lentisphaerota bacterium]